MDIPGLIEFDAVLARQATNAQHEFRCLPAEFHILYKLRPMLAKRKPERMASRCVSVAGPNQFADNADGIRKPLPSSSTIAPKAALRSRR